MVVIFRFRNLGLRLATAILSGAMALSSSAAGAETRVPINQEERINATLLAAAIGKAIIDNCSSIDARYFVVWSRARALERYAEDQGYSEEEVDAFISSKDEKRRLRRAARAYLVANGVVAGDEETYCALGKSEIENDTATGQLLRQW